MAYRLVCTCRAIRRARGLNNFRNRSFRPPNITRCRMSVGIVDHESAPAEFAQAGFPIVLFSVRVPSGALQIRGAFTGDEHKAFSPQEEKALSGGRTVGGEIFLPAKLSRPNNLASGCILRRPCFRASRARAHLRCPVHSFLPAAMRRVAPEQAGAANLFDGRPSQLQPHHQGGFRQAGRTRL